MKIMWKKLNAPLSLYSVSSNGRIRNDKTGYVFNNKSKVGKYIRARLSKDDGTIANMLVHRVVAMAFIPNLENKKFVDHVDRNPANNNVLNLRWVSAVENGANTSHVCNKKRPVSQFDFNGNLVARYERIVDAPFGKGNIISACLGKIPHAYGFVWKYYEVALKGEEFRKIDFNGKTISVSNLGRVVLPSGSITYGGSSVKNGYKVICVNKKSIVVHKLVAMAFLGNKENEKAVINHIDNNKSNNQVSNLEYVSQSKNTFHSYNSPRKKTEGFIRKVKSISKSGVTNVYNSIAEASRATGVSNGNICMCCKGTRPFASGMVWQYVNDS